MNNEELRVAIIGVGLIGGSIALNLKKQLQDKVLIHGMCKTDKRTHQAVKSGLIDNAFTFPGTSDAYDVIIIATPILDTLEILPQLKKNFLKKTLIFDTGSTKESICKKAEKIGLKSFIGTHPLAGKEISGFENADPSLFVNKPWVICPTKTTDKNTIERVEKFIALLGAVAHLSTPEEHDKDIAWASHIHLILANIMLEAIQKNSDWKMVRKLASTGFRDSTRLGRHNTRIKTDIALTNNQNISDGLAQFQKSIGAFLTILKRQNYSELLNYFNRTKALREEWIEKYDH